MYQLTKALPSSEKNSKSSGYNPLVLAGLVRRVCKLLYFDIKPVFVFDGGVPLLKKNTISERKSRRAEAESRYKRLAKRMLKLRMSLVALGVQPDEEQKGVYEEKKEVENIEDSISSESDYDELDYEQLDGIDIESDEFKSLPLDLRQELLMALKEKVFTEQMSRSRLIVHEEDSLNFSKTQIESLVKRRRIVEELERTSKSDFGTVGLGRHEKGTSHRIAASSSREFVLLKTQSGGWVFCEDKKDEKDEEEKVTVAIETGQEGDDFERQFFAEEHDLPVVHKVLKMEQPATEPVNEEELAGKETDEKTNEEVFDPEPIVDQIEASVSYTPTIEFTNESPKNASDIDAIIVITDRENPVSADEEIPSKILPSARKEVTSEEYYLEQDDEDEVLDHFEYKTSDEYLERLQESLQTVQNDMKAAENEGRMIEDELTADFQKLLNLFGLPWMIAPMEAEAQCAWLKTAGLVDGIITDDSDVLVFSQSGTLVYRHFFKDKHPVQVYSAARIELQMGLRRADLVILAMLLGGDYGVGVRGVGVKRGVELLKILKEADIFRSINPELEAEYCIKVLELFKTAVDDIDIVQSQFELADLKRLEKITSQVHHLDDDFPNQSIVDAYLNPRVSEDKRPFIWGTPNPEGLERFLCSTIGWTPSQFRSIVFPILKKLAAQV